MLQVPLKRLRPLLLADPDFATRLAQMADASTEAVIRVTRDLLIRNSGQRLRRFCSENSIPNCS
ncbi:MAG: hypothetical protein ACK5SX_14150 [Sandaracinobacter sp.]